LGFPTPPPPLPEKTPRVGFFLENYPKIYIGLEKKPKPGKNKFGPGVYFFIFFPTCFWQAGPVGFVFFLKSFFFFPFGLPEKSRIFFLPPPPLSFKKKKQKQAPGFFTFLNNPPLPFRF